MSLQKKTFEDPSLKESGHTNKRSKLGEENIHGKSSPKEFNHNESGDVFSTIISPSNSSVGTDSNRNLGELNNYALGHIFSFLDLDSLKNCRLVSKNFNEETSRQLGNKCWFKIKLKKIRPAYTSRPRRYFWYSSGEECSQQQFVDYWTDDNIQKGLDCLSNLYNPCVFTNFVVYFELLKNEKYQEVFKKYGPLLKRIIIICDKTYDFSLNMDIVCKILTKWCPNLTAFEKTVITIDRQGQTAPPKLKWVEPNYIRELKIGDLQAGNQSNFWIQLIKACPLLTKLNISFTSPVWESITKQEIVRCESFFEKLSELPEITKNLMEFSWNGGCGWDRILHVEKASYNILIHVSNMEFSNKLKKIGIGASTDNSNGNLRRLLEKLNECGTQEIILKEIHSTPSPKQMQHYGGVCLPCGCEVNKHKLECLWEIDHIPQMPKVTSIKSSAKYNYELGAFHFLHKFPNLETYEMPEELHRHAFSQAEVFAPELFYMSKFPHYNLRTLVLKPAVFRSQTLKRIVNSFPNLTSLRFEVGRVRDPPHLIGYGLPTNGISFKAALSLVSKCQRLNELTVSFLSKYSPAHLSKAFGVVKDFPKLEILTLNGWDCEPKMSFQKIKSGLYQLSNLPTCVYLVGYKVTKFETLQMEKYCDRNHIRAKFIPDMGKKFVHPGPFYLSSEVISEIE